jgi:hypothetical protein
MTDPPQVHIVERYLVPHLDAVHNAPLAPDIIRAGISGPGPICRGSRPGRGRQPAEPLLHVLLTATPGVTLASTCGPLSGLYLGTIVAPRCLPDVKTGRARFQ